MSKEEKLAEYRETVDYANTHWGGEIALSLLMPMLEGLKKAFEEIEEDVNYFIEMKEILLSAKSSKSVTLVEYQKTANYYQKKGEEIEEEFLRPILEDLENSIKQKDNDRAIAIMHILPVNYLDKVDVFGGSALYVAAEQGNYGITEWLVENHPDLIKQVNVGGYSPLHTAALYKHEDIAKLLLGGGANKAAVNKAGQTPADCARIGGEGYIFPANEELAQFIEKYEMPSLGDNAQVVEFL